MLARGAGAQRCGKVVDVDPLKPFANLIRSMSSAAKTRNAQTAASSGETTAASGAAAPATGAAAAAPVIRDRLSARLPALAAWDAKRARECFVETILLQEFGADLVEDQDFFDLVQRVSVNLESEPAIRARLDEVLRELAATRPSR